MYFNNPYAESGFNLTGEQMEEKFASSPRVRTEREEPFLTPEQHKALENMPF